MRQPRPPRSRSSSRIRSSASGLLLVVAVAIAAPQPVEPQNASSEAAASFDQGTDYFGRGQFALALESFRTAYRLRAHPAILLNIATCLDRLNRAVEAVAEYHRYRRLRGSGIEPERRRFVDDALRRLGPQVSLVWITQPAPDAPVAIDGTLVEIGEDPLVVAPGPHTIESQLPDGRTAQTELTAVGGQVHQVALQFPGAPPGGEPDGPGAGASEDGTADPGTPPIRDSMPSRGWDPSLRWIGLGATVVFGVTLIYTASRTISLSNEFEELDPDTEGQRRDEVKEEGVTFRTLTEFVFFPATLVSAGFTVLAFVFAADGDEAPPTRSVMLLPTRDGLVLSLDGTF